MFRSRQLCNNIRRYTHSHNSPSNNCVKTENCVKTDNCVNTEYKIYYIGERLKTIEILLTFNYGFALIFFGWFSVFK